MEDRMLANLKPNRLVPLETCGTYLLKNYSYLLNSDECNTPLAKSGNFKICNSCI